MTTLTEFLLARIAEDEAVARDAIDPDRPGTHWRWEAPDEGLDPDGSKWLRTAEEFPTTSGVGPLPAFPLGYEYTAEPSRAMTHIARHDPARVLAECEAKRRIVEQCEMANVPEHTNAYTRGLDAGFRHGLLEAVAALAVPYADHPDYRQEWKL